MKLKYYFFILIVQFFLIFNLNAQSKSAKNKSYAIYEVIYAFNSEVEAEKVNSAPAAMKKTAADVEKLLQESRSILLCNRTHSINYVESTISSSSMADVMAKAMIRSDRTYYIDLPVKSAKVNLTSPGEISLLMLDEKIVWDISDETALINGLRCIKADGIIKTPGFKDTKITAWFTPDLPISLGPHGLFGLPGLILKYKCFSLIMTASSIRNIENQKINIEIPPSDNLKNNSENIINLKKPLPKNGKK